MKLKLHFLAPLVMCMLFTLHGFSQLNPGCITTKSQSILVNTTPPPINTIAASGGNCLGFFQYQWQISTDNINFTDIPGPLAQYLNLTYSVPLTQTTWFQRKVTCGGEIGFTLSIRISVGASVWWNTPAASGIFTRNDCSSGVGSNVTYTVPANTYSSNISQADANQQAQNDLYGNGQYYANVNGTCCVPGFTFASGITQIVSPGISVSDSIVSMNPIVFNYPSGATNFTIGYITGPCTFPTASRTIKITSGSAKFDITIGTTGNVVLQLVSGTPPSTLGFSHSYNKYLSQVYNVAKSGYFTRNNCTAGQTGSGVTYNVAAEQYYSTIDQVHADQKAQDDVNNNGQNYANANGTCSTPCTFAPSFSFLTNSISSTATTVSFNFAFLSPSAGWNGGTIGTISTGCRPTVTRTVTVTDGATSSRSWSVTIQTNGVISISKISGPATTTSYPPIVLNSSFTK